MESRKTGNCETIGYEYAIWMAEWLYSFESTSADPHTALDWVRVAHFPAGRLGACPLHGDTWYRVEWDGDMLYSRERASGRTHFGAARAVDRCVRAEWQHQTALWGEVEIARCVLIASLRHDREPQEYDDVYLRLARMDGIQRYVRLAGREEWLIAQSEGAPQYDLAAAALYGVPHAVMQPFRVHDGAQAVARQSPGALPHCSLWSHPTGAFYARTERGDWIQVPWHVTGVWAPD